MNNNSKQREISYVDSADIKAHCNILQVAYDWGMDVYPRGKRYGIYCPNPDHNDRNLGNCFIYEESNHFHCFACGASGGPIDLVMMLEKIDFREAVEKMGRRYGFVTTKTVEYEDYWQGLSSKEYLEFGLRNVTIKIPYDVDEWGRTLYRYERYSLQDLARENPEAHDEMLIGKFCERIHCIAEFLAMVNEGEFLQYGEEFNNVTPWLEPAGQVALRYKILLEKGLINKDRLEEIFTLSSGDNLMDKAKKQAREILMKKQREKINAVSI